MKTQITSNGEDPFVGNLVTISTFHDCVIKDNDGQQAGQAFFTLFCTNKQAVF